jgi:hypothetical protein
MLINPDHQLIFQHNSNIRQIYLLCLCRSRNKNQLTMQAVCPITDKRINERVARLNALVTVLLVTSFVFLHFWGALAILAVDFIIRGFFDSKYSPICQLNKWIALKLNMKAKMMNAGPKMFAAQVGMVLSIIALALFFKQCNTVCIAVASILGVFSFLESAFGYCVACKLYPLFRKIN